MKFALAACGMDNYPPAMAPWEPHAGREEILRFAKKADSLSWDWLTIPEHLVMPTAMAEHMGTRFVEGITAASVLMGATERIHMLTFVLVLPYRHPLLLAKQIATMEFIGGGRFTLGTAVGHLQHEFDCLNVPFEKRGPMADEYIAALKEAWTADKPNFNGEYVKFSDVIIEPKPVQKPHPPIFIGGNSKPAVPPSWATAGSPGWSPPPICRTASST